MIELQTMPLRFRAWDTQRKLFLHEDCYCMFSDGSIEANVRMRLSDGCDTVVAVDSLDCPGRFVISQDTGLKDKGGKSIFFGDILKDVEYGEESVSSGYGVVTMGQLSDSDGYQHGDYYCITIEHKDEDGIFWSNSLLDTHEYTEVVGNIWQNPELLEEE